MQLCSLLKLHGGALEALFTMTIWAATDYVTCQQNVVHERLNKFLE